MAATAKTTLLISLAIMLSTLASCILGGLFVIGDTFQNYAYFNFALGNLLSSGELPQWLPYAAYGSPAGPYSFAFMAPFHIMLALLGATLGITDAWLLFIIATVIELVIYVMGVWLLASELYKERLTVFAITVGATLFICWHISIFWSHRLLVYLPLFTLYALRFSTTKECC